MGMVHLRLDLPKDQQTFAEHTLTLRSQNIEAAAKQNISGTITVQYEWTPDISGTIADGIVPIGAPAIDSEPKGDPQPMPPDPDSLPALQGKLKITIMKAVGLKNMSYIRGRKLYANPFVMIFLYPNSPGPNENLCPVAWRSPCEVSTNVPIWGVSNTWSFLWHDEGTESTRPTPRPSPRQSPRPAPLFSPRGTPQPLPDTGDEPQFQDGEVMKELQRVQQEVSQLCEEVRSVSTRVFQKFGNPDPKVEPFAAP